MDSLQPFLWAATYIAAGVPVTLELTASSFALGFCPGDGACRLPRDGAQAPLGRGAIARALAMDPILLLLDEPTSALDPELRHEVVETLYEVAKQGRSMLIVTHELDFAEAAADRVVFIEGGVIVEEGDAREVLERPRKERTRRFLRRLRGSWAR